MAADLPAPSLDAASLHKLGFRCLSPTVFHLPGDAQATVLADGWMLRDQAAARDEAEARCLRFYHVLYSRGGLELLNENDLIALVGQSQFEQSP